MSAILNEPEPLASRDDSEEEAHDFGSVLARNQMLRHEFRVANRSDRTLRIVGSKVMVPCCLSLGKLPESIPPGGEATVAASLKVGLLADRKKVAFEIETVAPSRATRTRFVFTRFEPDWKVLEVATDRPDQPTLMLGVLVLPTAKERDE